MNVLIVRPDGIGDVLLSLPVATQLRQLVPDVRVEFLTSSTVAPLLEQHPDVDRVRTVCLTDPLVELRRAFLQGVEVAVFLKPFRRLMWAAWLARVPIRIATGYRWYSFLSNRRIYEHRSEFSKHESAYNVEMLRGLGLIPREVQPPTLFMTEHERTIGVSWWANLPSHRVVIHPGGFSARRWRPEYYWDLAVELAQAGYGVILTGSESEKKQFESNAPPTTQIPTQIKNCMGQLSLRQLMAVIAHAQVVVSGATGPAHMAAALGTPTVSLFDPRRNNLPVRWKPLGTGVVLRPDVPTCDKCIGEACSYWDCLDHFTVDKVATAIRQVIDAPSALVIHHV
jgi:ADP-heptose:LPS heptosyltransferase